MRSHPLYVTYITANGLGEQTVRNISRFLQQKNNTVLNFISGNIGDPSDGPDTNVTPGSSQLTALQGGQQGQVRGGNIGLVKLWLSLVV